MGIFTAPIDKSFSILLTTDPKKSQDPILPILQGFPQDRRPLIHFPAAVVGIDATEIILWRIKRRSRHLVAWEWDELLCADEAEGEGKPINNLRQIWQRF